MSDLTVVLQPGVHPAITRECCIVYEEAAIVASVDILDAVESKALRQHRRLDEQYLLQVQEGIFESEETPGKVVRYCTNRI